MMKKIMFLCFLLISIINDDIVECRPEPRRRHRKDDFMVFVFGDSFVDAGNRPPTTHTTEWSRQWFQPYGVSDSLHHHRATGRMSDGLVQSDFLARMLGQDESPPAYRLGRQSNDDEVVDASGVNFAMSGSAVVSQGEGGPPSLDDQIDQLSRLVRHGIIDREADLEDSVALIAFSGVKDYSTLYVGATHDEIMALAGNLIDRIIDGVKQLQDLGVSKVLVNSMPPIGCQPYQTWMSNYAQCDAQVNTISNLHNAALKKKLDGMEDVLVLDLDSTFTHLIQSAGFEGTYKPCCDGTSKPEGYCGEEDAQGKAQYSVCTNPEDFFYWDYVHPTQAGWEAVMDRLQQPILDFLGIYD